MHWKGICSPSEKSKWNCPVSPSAFTQTQFFPNEKREKKRLFYGAVDISVNRQALLYIVRTERGVETATTTFIFPYFVARFFSERYYLGDGVRR